MSRARVVVPIVVMLASGAGLLGCGGASGPRSLASQVTAWGRNAGFGSSLARLRADLTRAAGAPLGAPLRTACDVLVTDSLSDNDQLPTPDGPLTTDLSRAYASAAGAGRACFDGASGDQALLTEAGAQRARAGTELVVAEARYDQVTTSLPRATS